MTDKTTLHFNTETHEIQIETRDWTGHFFPLSKKETYDNDDDIFPSGVLLHRAGGVTISFYSKGYDLSLMGCVVMSKAPFINLYIDEIKASEITRITNQIKTTKVEK